MLYFSFLCKIIFILACNQTFKISNGYCNDETNVAECGFDGGDCCGSCINTDFCENCNCIGSVTGNRLQNDHVTRNGLPNALLADGFCNDQTINAHCFFDGLDCCRSPVDETFCSNCSCHGELIHLKSL